MKGFGLKTCVLGYSFNPKFGNSENNRLASLRLHNGMALQKYICDLTENEGALFAFCRLSNSVRIDALNLLRDEGFVHLTWFLKIGLLDFTFGQGVTARLFHLCVQHLVQSRSNLCTQRPLDPISNNAFRIIAFTFIPYKPLSGHLHNSIMD